MKAIWYAAAALGLAVGVGDVATALAQKPGGTLRIYHRDTPASASLHEEATVSTQLPFMAIYNNLVVYDQQAKRNTMETIVPDLAKSWEWDATKTKLTFKLNDGVKWHDGKPFTSADVKCTFDLLLGKGKQRLRKNPRAIWHRNVEDVTVNGPLEATIVLKEPQPAYLTLLASGYTPIYPCHVSAADMRTKPVGTGPFKFVEFRGNEIIRLAKNPDYFKKGKPYVDMIEMRIIDNRSTRILAFQAGEFDMTFSQDITIPLLKDMEKQAPKAICETKPQYVHRNLIVNREAAPFDNPQIRKAMALAIDRKAFVDILTEGKGDIGGAMLPLPEGAWGMPPEELAKMAGYGGDVAANRAEGRKIMESLGYSAAKPLKVKISTRNIAIYRDPAVILIDQLKQIYMDGELEVVDTPLWHAKVARKDYQVGMNLTGVAVDDPDANMVENYACKSERNYTGYCNPEVEKLIEAQSKIVDVAERKKVVWKIEQILNDDLARPVIYHDRAATCWWPYVKGFVGHENSIYNNWRFEDVWLDK
ncbi:MAG: peptide ABC transporter substrate-binding protein [Alphaproteobacteria bacterium 64-6]|uniref:ABC transporter substrate-binding protein n=1 Tax=Hyphomicrobium sp. CS1BSMeth3 TaxID=1892844 RepID=UPI000930F1E8|nr:ABC transporter substrate-binding protein [Hyphomicrobium sp. CS1BSMeth3]MBN9260907.1 ABC transporter substrate-binding protein [Hyphomicrobium sp.]OJU24789.1 MAG: peptide ABC transporter substrate-binding protein [Alphaproteobacteria bacterium 64-6]